MSFYLTNLSPQLIIQQPSQYQKLVGDTKDLLIQHIQKEDLATVSRLIAHLDPSDIEQDTSILALALPIRNEELIHLLLEKGFRADLGHAHGMPLLSCALSYGLPNIARMLIEKHQKNLTLAKAFSPPLIDMSTFIDAADIKGMTPLMVATFNRQSETVKLLLEYGADVNRCNAKGETPLHLCILRNMHAELLPLFLSLNTVNPNLENINGDTPLFVAIVLKNLEAIQILINSPKVVLTPKFPGGLSALHKAIEMKSIEIIALLLEKAPDLVFEGVDGMTVICLAKGFNQKKIVQYLKEKNPENYQLHREISQRKMLAHLTDVDGISKILKKDFSQVAEIKLGGFFDIPLNNFIGKRVKEFALLSSKFDRQFIEHLGEAPTFRANFGVPERINIASPNHIKNLFASWKEGNPIYVQAGTLHHTIGLCVWQDQLFWTNRWAKSNDDNTINCRTFCFDPSLFTEEILGLISNAQKSAQEKLEFLENTLPDLLNGKKGFLHETLENHKIYTQKPEIGNCSWLNIQGLQLPHAVFYKVMQLQNESLTVLESQSEIQKLIENEAILCDNLLSYYQFYVLRKAVNRVHLKDNIYKSDLDLISHVFTSCYPYQEEDLDSALIALWKELKEDVAQTLPKRSLKTFKKNKEMISFIKKRVGQIDQLLTEVNTDSSSLRYRKSGQFETPISKKRRIHMSNTSQNTG